MVAATNGIDRYSSQFCCTSATMSAKLSTILDLPSGAMVPEAPGAVLLWRAMKTRAAILSAIGLPPPYAQSRPLAIETVDLAPPGPGEVLVKVRAAGLCHSDLSVINGDRPRPVPMVLGHEAAGTVEALGAGVEDLKAGDHVVMVFVPSCGHCLPCSEGRPALCEPAFAANSQGTLLSG